MISRIREKYCSDLAHTRAGRPRVLSDQGCRQLVRMVTSDPLESSATAAKRLETSMSVHTNEGTVRDALYESGLVTVKKMAVSYLSEAKHPEATPVCRTLSALDS
jgi:hypothetical protein